MATTLKAIRRQMLAMGRTGHSGGLGRVESVASLTTTTAVVSALAVGTESSQKFAGLWLVRADAANTADRQRLISAYAASTGTLTHAGTNYADTTATDEVCEILPYEVGLYDNAIQEAMRMVTRLDRYILPTRTGKDRYFLNTLDWLTSPDDIQRVAFRSSPVATNNRNLEQWNVVTTGGVLQPDNWTLSGGTATMARSTTQNRNGAYSLAITRQAGTQALLTQTVGLLDTGVAGDNLRGKDVLGVFWVWSSVATQCRVQINDGVTVTSGSYHTGGSGWEELTVTATIGATATTVAVRLDIEADGVCYVDEGYLAIERSSADDATRRDADPEGKFPYRILQGAGTWEIQTPQFGRAGQIVVYSHRPYPQFDSARVAAGTADADASDVPLYTVATGAIWRLYENLAQDKEHPDAKAFGGYAAEWKRRFDGLASSHVAATEPGGFGLPLPNRQLAPRARR